MPPTIRNTLFFEINKVRDPVTGEVKDKVQINGPTIEKHDCNREERRHFAWHREPKPAASCPQTPLGAQDWAFTAAEGTNRYVFRLYQDDSDDKGTNNTDAIFKADPAPVICFANHITGPGNLITEVELVADNCISFVLNADEVRAAVVAADAKSGGRGLSYEDGSYVALPVYFNIYDKITNLPAWLAADHSHSGIGHDDHEPDHNHQAHGHHVPESIVGHGGIHPPGFVSYIYVDLEGADTASGTKNK